MRLAITAAAIVIGSFMAGPSEAGGCPPAKVLLLADTVPVAYAKWKGDRGRHLGWTRGRHKGWAKRTYRPRVYFRS